MAGQRIPGPGSLTVRLAGVFLSAIVTLVVARFLDRSILVLTVALVAASVVCILNIGLAHIVAPRLPHSTFRYQCLGVATSVAVIALLDGPVLAYLDLVAFWLALALAAWRIGCLRRGCCHGRPSRFGVVYPSAQAFPGIAPYYTGVRLFPVQALEAGSNVVLAVLILEELWTSTGDGAGLATWAVGYQAWRFFLEFLRGDATRRLFWGLSGAQWTSILIAAAVISVETLGWLPGSVWHWYAMLAMAASASGVAILTRAGTSLVYRIVSAPHMAELAQAVKLIDASIDDEAESGHVLTLQGASLPVRTFRTSAGLQLVGRHLPGPEGLRREYRFWFADSKMRRRFAKLVRNALLNLKGVRRPSRFGQEAGVFYLVI